MYKKDILWTNRIKRPVVSPTYKENYLRLDKNEWVGDFNKKIIDDTLKKISFHKIIAYPDQYKLYKLISKINRLKINQIVLTPGSDAGIKNCFELCFKKKGGELITLDPTYAMTNVYAKLYQTKNKKIKFDSKLSLNIKKLLNSINTKTVLIVLANPNSPTGTIISEPDIIKILIKAKKNRSIVLIDEAYYGFSKYSAKKLIKKFNNLIISRSLSKYGGIAGLRVGYLLTNKSLAKLLYNIKPTYEINSVGIEIACEILKKKSFVAKYFEEVKKCKVKVLKILKEKKISYINTNTNFIFINFGKKIIKFKREIKNEKILVGHSLNINNLKKFKRLTLGPIKSMSRFFKILNKL